MTAPDIDQDETVDDALADETPEPADELSAEDIDALKAALKTSSEQQPTMRLLPMDGDVAWMRRDGDKHFMSIGPHEVVVDTANQTMEVIDPEEAQQLLAARLEEVHGAEATFDVAGEAQSIDWTTVQILEEADGSATATATTVPDAAGETAEVTLTIDSEFLVDVAPQEPEDDAPADIDGDYLGSYYGDSEFPFDGKQFVIDWATWTNDQTTDEGLVGGKTDATSDGTRYSLYAWFDPDVGVQIVEAEPAAAASSDDADEDGHGITKEYLADYYGSDPLEFAGRGIVVDWNTWDPDQVTDDGLVGSAAKGVDDDGVEHDLYIWFDPEVGAQISTAEPVGGAAPAQAEVDPREHFENVLLPRLHEVCSGNGRRLKDTSGKEYDAGAWLDGDSDSAPVLDSFDGENFYLTMKMSTVGDEPKRVRCALKVRDADQVLVESEESA